MLKFPKMDKGIKCAVTRLEKVQNTVAAAALAVGLFGCWGCIIRCPSIYGAPAGSASKHDIWIADSDGSCSDDWGCDGLSLLSFVTRLSPLSSFALFQPVLIANGQQGCWPKFLSCRY